MDRFHLRRLFCALLCPFLLLSGCSGGASGNTTAGSENSTETPAGTTPATTDPAETDPTQPDPPVMSLLSVKDGDLRDADGNAVVLHGVNLGGWLLQESWMCAVTGSECNLDSLDILTHRFGQEKAMALFESYAENYITKDDIQNIADLGCNCVRLPFWYRNFMNEDGTFLSENPDEIYGFRMIDRLIEWCREYGVYVILDLHGAPGSQSTNHCSGAIGRWELFTSDAAKDAAVRLWTAIAGRYKDEPVIAAYDLLNEPMNNDADVDPPAPSAGSAEAAAMTNEVYDLLYKAIRAVDQNHAITVEGIWSTDVLPNPAEMGWENMIYQLHLYDTTKEMINYRVNELKGVREKYGVAVYVGEFNNSDDNQEYAYRAYKNAGLSWTMWNYKVGKDYLGNWGLYAANVAAPDLVSDSYEEILQKWGEVLRTEHFTQNRTVANWLRQFSG